MVFYLPDGLTLQSLADDFRLDALCDFYAQVFDDGVAALVRSLVEHHPASQPEYWLYVTEGQQIVSALALIPWTWHYAGVRLKCGEMGIVATRASHRNRGLIRILNKRFSALLHEGDFHLSHIQGIGYFYRQFGYEYALPLENQWRVELHQIHVQRDPAVCFRLASVDDVPVIMRLAEMPVADIGVQRSADVWHYLLKYAPDTETAAETWLIEAGGQAVAYCRISHHGFGMGLIVSEVTPVSLALADTILAWLRELAIAREKPYIRFNLAAENVIVQVARGYGAYDAGGYQWQIRLPDPAALLRQIAPVLERRLAASPLAGLTDTLSLNLYRDRLRIEFVDGQVAGVQSINVPVSGEISIPPNLLAALVLGWRSPVELAPFYPDLRVSGRGAVLLDILFPRMQAFIDTQY